MTITVDLTPEARAELAALPQDVRCHLVEAIRHNAPHSHKLMIVVGWTCALDDHIYRCLKVFLDHPGYRLIYYHKTYTDIVFVRICHRDETTYGDGH